ncbi:hypothetical protein TVAG_031490 [Trichomonas vaginalis G3]|uniref:Uncharacterized protein n=1 Tax=Trichomonas vaginalis (strain ATCC PRA-98 / G3) TaxID=412133 RepID=A2FKV1_TRIV3|nr:GTPase protein [Trichomonas vaginalis G3]EAX94461.1 hypothetical protein TVAG_031490 [Trichomonas vaginalis G3]KAI5512883.1 GTPase protein [Trichomonas vaginalis G3]|eukprot:XP_001307391.1 hypothetical protein [Trichomonas vaginalis G3]
MTKSDLHTPQEIQEFKSSAEAEFQEYNGKGVFVTSALAKEGVNELFQAAAEMYKSRNATSQSTPRQLEKKKEKGSCC